MLPPALESEILRILEDPPGDSELLLDQLCAAHPDRAEAIRARAAALRRELERDDPAATQPASTRPEHPAEAADRPSSIGPYRILEVLGEGGMGVVFLGEQKEPVHRRVALKVIRLGMDTKEVLARFELERRALAAMSHGSIAKVFDAGRTERGQPYFVMELVQGLPLTDYCDRHRLSLKERIALFQQVCAGVQHAHQKGVIHRDLKPGNILVVREAEQAIPKILDFGLAKATNLELVQQTIYTERERVLGTPEYMAPEQAALDGEAIDTRADIYSLGVILYELLTGQLPFSSEELRKAGWLEIRRILTEVEPPKPSTRISTLGVQGNSFADKRRATPPTLGRALRGDLDWIVLKAMSKEPERRYDSATGLAMDLRRYLEHEPVLAGPPSAGYRLRKLLRRHRGQFLAAGLVVLTLFAGIATTTVFAIRSDRERDNATRATRTASRVRELLENILISAQPGTQPDPDLKVRDLLRQAAVDVGVEVGDEPEVHAGLLFTIARAYQGLGLHDEARDLGLRALDIRRRFGLTEHVETGLILVSLAEDCIDGRVTRDEAEAMLNEAAGIFTRLQGPDSPYLITVGAVRSFIELNSAIDEDERTAVAIRFYRQFRRLDSDEAARAELVELLKAIGDDWRAGRHAEARARVREKIEAFPVLKIPFMSKEAIMYVFRFAQWTEEKGLDEVAEPVLRENLAVAEELFKPTDPTVSLCRMALSVFLVDRDRLDEAAELLESCLSFYESQFADGAKQALDALTGLLVVRIRQGREGDVDLLLDRFPPPEQLPDEGIGYARRIVEELVDADQETRAVAFADLCLGSADHASQQSTEHALMRQTLGELQLAAEQLDSAEANLTAAFDVLDSDPGTRDTTREKLIESLVELYTGLGQTEEAERWRSLRR